jgi:hypothetical protein
MVDGPTDCRETEGIVVALENESKKGGRIQIEFIYDCRRRSTA